LKLRVPSSNSASAVGSAFAAEPDHGIDGNETDEHAGNITHSAKTIVLVVFGIDSSPNISLVFFQPYMHE
jgi:hypothetical protein